MTVRPNQGSHRHRPVTIRAAFVSCHDDTHSCMQYGQEIWPVWPATDRPRDGNARMTGLITTSCQRATIQIPIAMWSTPNTVKHPAVSSLEAYPTPTH